MPHGRQRTAPRKLLDLRSALLLFIATGIGGLIGALTFASAATLPAAVVAGLLAFGAALPALNNLID